MIDIALLHLYDISLMVSCALWLLLGEQLLNLLERSKLSRVPAKIVLLHFLLALADESNYLLRWPP